MCKRTFHHRRVHAKWDINNAMARFNGTVCTFPRRMRGLKSGDSPVLEGMRVHHNHVRPHEGIGNLAPGEAAGVLVRGRKWLALVQHGRLLQKKIS